MQNTNLIVPNKEDGSNGMDVQEEEFQAELKFGGIQNRSLQNERIVEEHATARQSIFWPENQPLKARQSIFWTDEESSKARQSIFLTMNQAPELSRGRRSIWSSKPSNSTNGIVEGHDDVTKKKVDRSRRLTAEWERLVIEEDGRKKAAEEKMKKDEANGLNKTVTKEDEEIAEDEEAEEVAIEIVQGIYDKISFSEYANFLGAKENHRILQKFIVLLEPLPDSLVLALYKLVTRIYFIAEAQAIDRILEELSIGWINTNPSTHWGSHCKLCHIVLFSLLILNSDLHNVMNSQPKFSKDEFIDNTIFAIKKESSKSNYNVVEYEAAIREELGTYYEALRYMSLPLCSKEESKKSRRESRDNRGRLVRKPSKTSTRSQMNNSMETSSSDDESTAVSSSSPAKMEPHYTSNWRFHNNKPLPRLYRKEALDEPRIFSNGSSWCMDWGIKINERDVSTPDPSAPPKPSRPTRIVSTAGGVLRWITRTKPKSSLLQGNKSPVGFLDGNTKWVCVRCRVCEGRIFVFKKRPSNMGPQDPTEDLDDLKKGSELYFVFSLYEALATIVQENVVINNNKNISHIPFSRQGESNPKGNFTVTIPAALRREKTVLEFQTSNVKEAQRFAQCVNFWAARLTPVPTAQFEIVSNEENGWSPRVLSGSLSPRVLSSMRVSDWKPLLSITHLYTEQESTTEETAMADKVIVLENFVDYLQKTIDSHNKVKPLMFKAWQNTANFEKAMENWNKKYLYLNELNEKSSVYLNAMKLTQHSVKQK